MICGLDMFTQTTSLDQYNFLAELRGLVRDRRIW